MEATSAKQQDPEKQRERQEGAALVRATAPWAKEDRALTWRLLASTLLVYGVAAAAAAFAPWWPAQLVAGLIAGLTIVRLFIFTHDHLHGAILTDSPVGKAILSMVGLFTLNPPTVWRETHDYHHRNNAKMVGASIGSYPVITVAMWKQITPGQRRAYAIARHPLTMLFGYFTIFAIGMCLSSFRRAPRQHWGGPLALALHVALVGAVAFVAGPASAFFAVVMPLFVACAAGSYLFYAQHNFPDIVLRDRQTWDYTFAALRSSSLFEMSPLMHWFTGNIGYHHIHHLNPKIPFYRLPEAMAALPALQSPGRTSWRPRDVRACLRLKLWDADRERMIGWDELRDGPAERGA